MVYKKQREALQIASLCGVITRDDFDRIYKYCARKKVKWHIMDLESKGYIHMTGPGKWIITKRGIEAYARSSVQKIKDDIKNNTHAWERQGGSSD